MLVFESVVQGENVLFSNFCLLSSATVEANDPTRPSAAGLTQTLFESWDSNRQLVPKEANILEEECPSIVRMRNFLDARANGRHPTGCPMPKRHLWTPFALPHKQD